MCWHLQRGSQAAQGMSSGTALSLLAPMKHVYLLNVPGSAVMALSQSPLTTAWKHSSSIVNTDCHPHVQHSARTSSLWQHSPAPSLDHEEALECLGLSSCLSWPLVPWPPCLLGSTVQFFSLWAYNRGITTKQSDYARF